VDGYANLIATRLRKLAEDRSTGALPVSGPGDGAVFFRDGQVVHAASSRTFQRATGLAAPGSVVARQAADTSADAPASVARLTGLLDATEMVVDALTELLSSSSRFAKFRSNDSPPDGEMRPVSVETLLAEVQRRHELLRQLAPVVTPDTVIACEPSLSQASVQLSPAQWALLMRADEAATPRGLALALGLSVFATTIEAYRLVDLGLLAVPGRPATAITSPVPAMSFIRANQRKVSDVQ